MTSPSSGTSFTRQFFIILLLMGFTGLGHFNRNSISVVGAEIFIPEGRFQKDQMGWIYASLLICYTTCMIPGGWVIDRCGPRATLAMMGLGSAAFVALTGLVGIVPGFFSFGSFILVRGVLGAIFAPLHPACARMVSLTIPRERQALANGLVTGAALLGISAIYLCFGFLLDRFGWPGAFLVSALLTLCLTIAWVSVPARSLSGPQVMASSPPVSDVPDACRSFMALITNKRLLLLAFSYGGYSYFQYLFFYWMQHYFVNALKLNTNDSRFFSTIPLLAMAAGMPLGGWLADRFGKQKYHPGLVPIIALVLGAAVGLLGTLLTVPLQVSVCFALALGLLGLCEGPYWTMGVALGGKSGGMSGAILNTIGNAGGILATVLTPYLSDIVGGRGSFALASLACLFGAVLWIPLHYQPETELPASSAP